MDGTLIEAKNWHYLALNEALEIFGMTILEEEHLRLFDGLPTRKKLEILASERGLPEALFSLISDIKQERTLRLISKECFPRVEQLLLFQWLKENGLKVGVATNSIRQTATRMLENSGIFRYLDVLSTNEDVSHPKPHPEIYRNTASFLGIEPRECLVVEDNPYGVISAKEAGCQVVEVQSVEQVRIGLLEGILGKGNLS